MPLTRFFALQNLLCHAVVKVLCGPESDDGVDNCRRVHRGAAVDDGYEDGILLAVVAAGGVWID